MNDSIVQKNIDGLINKNTRTLQIEAEYIVPIGKLKIYKYEIVIEQKLDGKYYISYEKLKKRKSLNNAESYITIYEVLDGVLSINIKNKNIDIKELEMRSLNLLSRSSFCSLYINYMFLDQPKMYKNILLKDKSGFNEAILFLFMLGFHIVVYLEDLPKHAEYSAKIIYEENEDKGIDVNKMLTECKYLSFNLSDVISTSDNLIPKSKFSEFSDTVKTLKRFIQIFQPKLETIEIDKKDLKDSYSCNLIMVYKSYSIDAEYESTGIKKLITLFSYLNDVMNGYIVFIDELDANLHDVYLCALLEFLGEYGKGQLCFTTHNIGPMSVLKKYKKSLDFLSEDGEVFSWKKNGNYSPANLYREGMIEGSPLNIHPDHFIGTLGTLDYDEI